MRIFNQISITFISIFLSASAFAGNPNILIHAPYQMNHIAVPTLSGTMLILLSLLLVAVAFRIGKNKNNSGTPMMLVGGLVLGAVLSVTGGVKLISEVNADSGGFAPIPLSNPSGAEVGMFSGQLNIFENTSGVPQQIVNIILNGTGFAFCPNNDSGIIDGVSRCAINSVVPTSMAGLCYIDCRFGAEL